MLKNLCQKMFGRSLWVYHANSGGCNGCDIEILALPQEEAALEDPDADEPLPWVSLPRPRED